MCDNWYTTLTDACSILRNPSCFTERMLPLSYPRCRCSVTGSLTLKLLVTTIDALGHFRTWIITAQWEGMGDIGLARYKSVLLLPCLTIRVLSYSNCERSTNSISKWLFRNLALVTNWQLNKQYIYSSKYP